MEESKGFVGGESQKPHPEMPSISFQIPMPGRNRSGGLYPWGWRQRAIIPQHTVRNSNGASENTNLKV
ncbi:hypothetical protein JHK82_023920 [Glycine max]|uniref:Uncharacterized protein n=2 Tax=Glycine subgen. Soja TaxID=1462606 RepID=K7LBN2_SOYBN|nr:hypothetical protein JHK87_023874 [Glycine soja]KAG5005941.1 hypothetical protein JHK85_024483 [Glycine max]KAG5011729.1 hypothetical protein JHK86_023990 [Glycine max]KAG5132732.1 hypothetical protein JHK82_023920 [Glycine max]KAH1041339.1 hypothetical protein GYH30_023935 [Glycine max]